MPVPAIHISPESPDSEDARRLFEQLDEDLYRRYPALRETHGLHAQDLIDPDFTLLIARIDGTPVGCGALRRLSADAGEVKRMFVLPALRGRGIARRILAVLEARARDRHYASIRLETGVGQPEAIGLYKSAGYSEIAGFGAYAGNPFSVCFEKRSL